MAPENESERVQSLVVDLVDKHLCKVYECMDAQAKQIQNAETDRANALAQLAKAWVQVDRVNMIVEKLTNQVSTATTTHNEIPEKHQPPSAPSVAKYAADLNDARSKILQLQQINTAFSANIHVHKQVHRSLVKDNLIAQNVQKVLEAELAREHKKLDAVVAQNNALQLKLADQQNETRVAQCAIKRMSDEIHKSTQIRHALEKQWEDAMGSMTKRDTALAAVDKVKVQAQNDLKLAQLEIQSLKDECERLIADKDKHLREINEQRLRIEEATSKCKTLETNVQTAESASQKTNELLSIASRDACEERTARVRADKQVVRLKAVEVQLRAELNTKRDAAVAADPYVDPPAPDPRPDSACVRAQNEIGELVLTIQSLRQQVAAFSAERKVHDSKYLSVVKEADKLSAQIQQVSIESEKKDLMLSRSVRADTDTKPLELTIQSLESELCTLKSDKLHAQSSWLKLENRNRQLEHLNSQMRAEIQTYRTKSIVQQAGQVKAQESFKDTQKHTFELNMQLSESHVELQALRPRVKELEECNAVLESQLAQYAMRMAEHSDNAKCAVHMLKHDLRRVSTEKAAMSRVKLVDQKSMLALEQKLRLVTEMLAKSQSANHALKRQNAQIQFKWTQQLAKVSKLNHNWTRVAEIARVNACKKVTLPEEADYEIHDVPALKLRNHTLTLENMHLTEEIAINKMKLSEFESSHTKLNTAALHSQMMYHQVQELLDGQIRAYESAVQRAKRAENAAAFLELHVRDARPNTRLDYSSVVHHQFDASPALQAVFLKHTQPVHSPTDVSVSRLNSAASPDKNHPIVLPKLATPPPPQNDLRASKSAFGHYALTHLSTPQKLLGL